MFVNVLIKWVSTTMVDEEDVSIQTNFPPYFLILVSEVQKIYQIQWNERHSELLIFQPWWGTPGKWRYVIFSIIHPAH